MPPELQETFVLRSRGLPIAGLFEETRDLQYVARLEHGHPFLIGPVGQEPAIDVDRTAEISSGLCHAREAGRQVQTNQQRVKSARASRELQEKKLEAEEKKQAAGMSTSFFVFQAQRDLAQARTYEIQAISDYNKSLVDFEAVQEVPLSGGR